MSKALSATFPTKFLTDCKKFEARHPSGLFSCRRPGQVARMDIDFLIIGAGIAGLSAAVELSALGHVLVLEGEDAPGYHASGRSAALFDGNYGAAPVVALSEASLPELQAAGGLLSERGIMFVAAAHQAVEFAGLVSDHQLQVLNFEQAARRVPLLKPGAVAFAGYTDQAWDMDTDLMLQGYARVLRAAGGRVECRQQVNAITRVAEGWLVRTVSGAEYRARNIVNAAGAWADQLAVMAGIKPIGITPMRRSMARIPAPGGLDVKSWPMVVAVDMSFYCKPDAGSLIVSPAEEDLVEPHDAWADDMVLAEGLARYEEMVTEPVTRLESSWAGLRSFAPDEVLVLGPSLQDERFVWAAGQGGYGFQTAPASARLIADLVAGRVPELAPDMVRALSAERFG
jgi:D-arginine dehydrogenase